MVSVKRLSEFLHADELQPDARELIIRNKKLEEGDEVRCTLLYVCSYSHTTGLQVLSISNGEFYWNKDAASPTLEDINLTVKKGELVGILGRVGAGKVGCCTSTVEKTNSKPLFSVQSHVSDNW